LIPGNRYQPQTSGFPLRASDAGLPVQDPFSDIHLKTKYPLAMQPEWERLHSELQAALTDCLQQSTDALKSIECCFIKSEQYWTLVKNQVNHYVFPAAADEIHFFKHIKPAFTSQVEYYNLLYHVEIFKPVSTEDLRAFWLREGQRLNDFIALHDAFYRYYKSGDTQHDEQYFTRAGSDAGLLPEAKVYDRDANAATGYDHLITSILALERFTQYVNEKLAALPG